LLLLRDFCRTLAAAAAGMHVTEDPPLANFGTLWDDGLDGTPNHGPPSHYFHLFTISTFPYSSTFSLFPPFPYSHLFPFPPFPYSGLILVT
jgi:hypothetical protein